MPTALVHGWDDELCPVDEAIAFARARGDAITLLRDDHRLSNHVDFIAEQFRLFLLQFCEAGQFDQGPAQFDQGPFA